jgi:hypothetical protein
MAPTACLRSRTHHDDLRRRTRLSHRTCPSPTRILDSHPRRRHSAREPSMTHPSSSPTGGSDRDGVNLRLIWPSGRAAAHPASESSLPNSRSTSPAAAPPLARQSSKPSCRRTTAPPLPRRSGCQTPASRHATVSKPRPSFSNSSQPPCRSSASTTRRGSRPSAASAP